MRILPPHLTKKTFSLNLYSAFMPGMFFFFCKKIFFLSNNQQYQRFWNFHFSTKNQQITGDFWNYTSQFNFCNRRKKWLFSYFVVKKDFKRALLECPKSKKKLLISSLSSIILCFQKNTQTTPSWEKKHIFRVHFIFKLCLFFNFW